MLIAVNCVSSFLPDQSDERFIIITDLKEPVFVFIDFQFFFLFPISLICSLFSPSSVEFIGSYFSGLKR